MKSAPSGFPSDFKIPENAGAIVPNARNYQGGISADNVLKYISNDSNRSLKDVCQQLVNDEANRFKWEEYTIMAAFIKDFRFNEKMKRGYENRYQEFQLNNGYTFVFINVSQRYADDWDTYNPETRKLLQSQCVAFAE